MRSAVGQTSNAYNQANNTSATLGGEGQAIGANLTPFLTQEMLHPQGLGQQGITAETSAALGGAGGAMSAFNGEAAQRAGASRNAGGFQAALDDASRQRMKAAAGASEGIQAQNENLKQTQQQEGAKGLQGMYGTDTSGMLESQGQETNDINAGVNASKSGWLQNAGALLGDAAGVAGMAGGFGIPGFSGFKGK
jgi:hypothetical protein